MTRISTQQLHHATLGQVSDLMSRALDAQRRIGGGARIVQASQDAGALARASELGQLKSRATVFEDNLAALDTGYALADVSLGSIASALQRATVQLTAARNGALGANEKGAIGDALRQELTLIANELGRTDARGLPLYSGGQADADHPALEVRPGLTMGSELPLAATDEQALAGLAGQPWALDLSRASDAEVSAALGTLSQLQDSVVRARSAVGARWQAVAGHEDANASLKLAVDEARSDLLDPDIGAAMADFTQAQAQLEAARSLFARIQSSTLFDRLA